MNPQPATYRYPSYQQPEICPYVTDKSAPGSRFRVESLRPENKLTPRPKVSRLHPYMARAQSN